MTLRDFLRFLCWQTLAFTLLFVSANAFAHSTPNEFRLGSDIVPMEQFIALDLDPENTEFSGTTRITLQIKKATRAIKLHSKGLSFTEISLKANSANGTANLTSSEPNQYDIITLYSEHLLAPGIYELTMTYQAKFSQGTDGLYRFEQGDNLYLATQFQAMQARTVFPAFDEPGFKLPFTFAIKTPSKYRVLGNTKVRQSTEQNGHTTHLFFPTRRINTDVLALAVGNFNSVEIKGLPVPAKIYTTKGQTKSIAAIQRDIPSIFNAVQTYFASPFPYQKLDFLILPVYGGAGMENVGLITLHQDWVSFSDNEMGSYSSHKLVAHEIIHMWFGNLVSMAWWDDLWLNESFSEWLADKLISQQFPEFKGDLYLPQLDAFWDDTPTTPVIKRQVRSLDDYHAIGQIVYTKGHALIAMIEEYVGERTFQQAMIDYIQQFQDKNVAFIDFIQHIERHTGLTLYPIFYSFLSQPQFPLVSFTLNENKLVIQQRPFAQDEHSSSTQPALLWHLPLRLKLFTKHGVKVKPVLLDKAQISLPISESTYALFPDAGALGYFRYQTHLPDRNKQNVAWLTSLTPPEQRSLLANNKDLVRGNYLSYASALELQLSLLNSPDLSTDLTKEILQGLYNDFFDVIPISLQAEYRTYVTRRLSQSLEKIRWYRSAPSTHKQRVKNTDLQAISLTFLGSKLADKGAIAFAKVHYQDVLSGRSILHINMQNAVLDVMASQSNQQVFQRFKQAYTKSTSAELKSRLIRYMGYFSYSGSVADYYDFLFSKAVKKEEFRSYYLQYPAYNPSNQLPAIQYLERDITRLLNRVPEAEKQWQPYSFASGCSPDVKQRLNQLYQPFTESISGLKDKLANVNHMINQCINMQASNYKALQTLFDSNNKQ